MSKYHRVHPAIVHLTLLVVAFLAFVGTIYQIKATQRSIAELKNWRLASCISTNLTCGVDSDTYVTHCAVTGYYLSGGINFTYEFDDFEKAQTVSEIRTKYSSGNSFKCYYTLTFQDMTARSSAITLIAPVIDYNYLIYEYLFSLFIGILIGYLIKGWMYYNLQQYFIPQIGWETSVEQIWDKKNKNSMDYPFDQLILIDMLFSMIIFTGLAFANVSSLNHIYGFGPIILLGIFGAFEHYADPNPFLRPSAKIHYVLANYSLSFSWCLVNILSKIVLCVADPFRDLITYIVSICVFLLWLVVKGHYFRMALHLWKKYYSNSLIQENEKANQ